MKKRKSVVTLSILTLVFLVVSVVLFVLCSATSINPSGFVLDKWFDVAFTKIIPSLFNQQNAMPLYVPITAIAIIVVFLGLFIAWIVIGSKKKAKSAISGSILSLFVCLLTFIVSPYLLTLFANMKEFTFSDAYTVLLYVLFIVTDITFLLLICLFIVDIVTLSKSNSTEAVLETTTPAPADTLKEETTPNEETTPVTPVANEVVEEEVIMAEPEEVKEEPVKTTKKGDNTKKMKETKKPVTKKAPAKKAETKKPVTKKAPAKKVAPKAEEKKDDTKVYHVSKRAADNRWVIKFAGGEKVIKTFATKVEACAYADELAKNQNGVVLTHASKGKKQGKINGKRKSI